MEENKDNIILSIQKVNKKYKLDKTQSFQALFDVSLDFKMGELVSIVGESGSGKSTLMNLIGGLDSLFDGKIIVDNKNLRELSPKELDRYRKDKVGFVFQSFNLIPYLSILENVTMALTLSNVSEKEKEERATKILKSVGLQYHMKKKPSQLSGGQKQRVAIARALINDPDIIIADEPTGALDSATSMQILKILKKIADSGKLVIMVTHSEKVAKVSSRVIEISDGRIVSDKINPSYKAHKEKISQTKKNPTKQYLSVYSALHLSFLNMWANKTKNFFMSFGVAIGIGSLILMLCFSFGISNYINDTRASFSDPTIVTISKKSTTSDMKSYEQFTDEEITNIIDDLNKFLEKNNYNFVIDTGSEEKNVTYGFEAFATDVLGGGLSASISCDFNLDGEYTEDETMKIYYLYSTPPYYGDKNLIKGEMSSSEGGIMVNSSILQIFDDLDSALGKKVKITINYDSGVNSSDTLLENEVSSMAQETFFFENITAIVDTSFLSNYPIMYIDYDLLEYHFERLLGEKLSPNSIYIKTPNEKITNAINSYLQENYSNELTGAIENSLASILGEMGNIIGTSLIVISLVALLVSAIMILVVMHMSVTERTKEIGVLKSIGARKSDIGRLFSCESLLIGFFSGLMGLVVSGVLILVAYLCLIHLVGLAPITFKWYFVAIALGVSIVISTLSGIYPAQRAANLDPVEALRRE